jgi:F-type H+-transporting ATPase subunit gamma
MTMEQTRQRRQAVDTIHDIVGALRAIAAGRIQGAQRAMAGARRYHQIVLRNLARVLAEPAVLPPPTIRARPTTLLVMTSEQPLCGAFNQNVLALAERRWRELCAEGETHLLLVGQRGLRPLVAHGIRPDRCEPAATSLAGLRDLVKRLATELGKRYAAGELGRLRAIYSRYQSISEQVPTEEQILPPDLTAIRSAVPSPIQRFHRYLTPPQLLGGLVHEYAFISLFRIAADSFASEQASRQLAMDTATRNTERMLQTLIEVEQRERQDEITRQVLELLGTHFAGHEPE